MLVSVWQYLLLRISASGSSGDFQDCFLGKSHSSDNDNLRNF